MEQETSAVARSSYKVHVLQAGYSYLDVQSQMIANGTSSLITGAKNVIVDTLTPWDGPALVAGLRRHGLTPDDINVVVCTHGHADHVGNNSLFLAADLHIVGHGIHTRDKWHIHPFTPAAADGGTPFDIDGDRVQVLATPGHTLDSVSVRIRTDAGVVIIAGDLFEKEEDLDDARLWKEAGSDSEAKQEESRRFVLGQADFIVPGHGPMFAVKKK